MTSVVARVYIAPTRALAQAKYRQLQELLAGSTELSAGLALVTGEDTTEGRRVPHGNFTVACMVYESASVLFSRNSRLLGQLGCIVVDEMHMINDLGRGPTLEVTLTKALMERRRIDSEASTAPVRDTLRVVAITTEQPSTEAMTRFLTVLDASTSGSTSPTVFRSDSRPVSVSHNLVLAPDSEQTSTVFPITMFSSTDQKHMPRQDVEALGKQLALLRKSSSQATARYPTSEVRKSLISFLVNKLKDRPQGYIALVFLPGRRDAQEMARQLRNAIRSSEIPKDRHGDLVTRMKPFLAEAEDQRMAKMLRPLVASGILVHHADIDKQVRRMIEEACAGLGNGPSLVVFATETLSYGVNMAVTDVILRGVEFNAQNRRGDATRQMITACAYHNMAGRAGRLGQSARWTPGVYVFVSSEEDPFTVVKNYYGAGIMDDSITSRIYVADDRARQFEQDQPFSGLQALLQRRDATAEAKYSALSVLDFSYPFVRTVLDALRHLNVPRAGITGDTAGTPVSLDQLINFFGNTLYGRSLEDVTELGLFEGAIARILDSCAEAPLHLVSVIEGTVALYLITDRGQAIIDTGTEVSTVEPLLRFTDLLHEAWAARKPQSPIPPEMYLLALVAQNEVFRGWIGYTPECSSQSTRSGWGVEQAEVNREAVRLSFRETLARVGVIEAEAFEEDLTDILSAWNPVSSNASAYSGGAVESVLRLFNALVSWICGDGQERIWDLIEVFGPDKSDRTRMQGFRQFTDSVAWKARFLSKMIVTARGSEVQFGPQGERQLLMLAARLQLGCAPEAIPLFWPQSSAITRRSAVELLARDLTPARILTMSDSAPEQSSVSKILREKTADLQQDLERYAITEFESLRGEFVAVGSDEPRREAMRELWAATAESFAKCVSQYRMGVGPSFELNQAIRQALLPEAGAAPGEATGARALLGTEFERPEFRVWASVSPASVSSVLSGERYEPDSDPARFTAERDRHLTALQMSADWTCREGNNEMIPFVSWLNDQPPGANLLVVPMPWTPPTGEVPQDLANALDRRAEKGGSLVLMSPAAMTVVLTSIVRDFITGKELFESSSYPPTSGPFQVFGVRQVIEVLHGTTLPQPIREMLLEHFEVES